MAPKVTSAARTSNAATGATEVYSVSRSGACSTWHWAALSQHRLWVRF